MITRFPFVSRSVAAAALAATFAGCVRTPASRVGTEIRRPTMPTVAAVGAAAPARAADTDEEILSTTLAAARANEFSRATRALNSIEDRTRRVRLATSAATALAGEDPSRAAAFASQLPPGQAQAAAIDHAAHAWVQRDPDAALRWAHGVSDSALARLARNAVGEQLVAANPRAAIDRVMTLPEGPARDDTLVLTAAAWARRDADAALGWIRGLPENDLRARVTSAVGFEVAQRKPDRAIELAEMLPSGRNRWLLFSAIGQTWVAVDQKAALAWASKLPAGEPRDAAFAGVDTGLGVPSARRSVSAPGTRGGASRTRGSASAVANWPEINSADFAAWLATQPPGLSRDEAILEYVRQRGALQPDAVGQWLVSLPGGPTRDHAMEIYLQGLLIGSPSDAARWLRSLPRSDRTDRMIEQTARRWLMTNPDAADAWLQDMPLPGYLKDRLLRDAGR